MPVPFILKIKEIFWSAQGEGLNSGKSSIFIRFTGCTLKCHWCDSKSSWTSGKTMSTNDILKQVLKLKNKYPRSGIILTGGEPLEQESKALIQLVNSLKQSGFHISIETNGLYSLDLKIDWWTVSPKSNSNYLIHPNLENKINELKLVVNESFTLKDLISVRKTVKIGVPIFLQPESDLTENYQKSYNLYQEAQEHDLQNVRLGIQLHKIFKID